MITREQTSKKVLELVKTINEEANLELEASEDTVIIGEGSQFDSMTFLDLIGMIEDWIDEEFDTFVSIASDGDDFGPDGPFANVGSLIDRLTDLIREEISA